MARLDWKLFIPSKLRYDSTLSLCYGYTHANQQTETMSFTVYYYPNPFVIRPKFNNRLSTPSSTGNGNNDWLKTTKLPFISTPKCTMTIPSLPQPVTLLPRLLAASQTLQLRLWGAGRRDDQLPEPRRGIRRCWPRQGLLQLRAAWWFCLHRHLRG